MLKRESSHIIELLEMIIAEAMAARTKEAVRYATIEAEYISYFRPHTSMHCRQD